MTRVVSPALATFCELIASPFHWQVASRIQLRHSGKDLTILGGFPLLAVSGLGNRSVDRFVR
jgi:uncharacterized membrane protein YphA (DoxX/SURF4 family)